MIIAGLVLAALAAVLHVYIFVLEAFLWTAPQGRATFGTSEEEARVTKSLAFNQGFYNLFLAIVTVIGIVWVVAGENAAPGHALVLAGTGSMLAAALELFLSAPDKRPAALKQGTLPLLAVVLLGVGLALA
jgi:putative membrane protein